MSTPLSDVAADGPAERDIFTALVDDAAVFPPGNAPLHVAVREHLHHRRAAYADLVGPLLIPPAVADGLSRLVHDDGSEPPLRVQVVARPGTADEEVGRGLDVLSGHPGIEVSGLETGWTPPWRERRPAGLPLVLEVPRGAEQVSALDDIAAAGDDSVQLLAKFRTGATPSWPWPNERELATFIRTAIDREVGFKLTGGLHHAVRGRYAVASGAAEEQHGLLNVLAAVRWALNGDEVDELVSLLGEQDPGVLVPMIERMSVADAAIVRAFFTAYGCCGVTDPIRELAQLHLIAPAGLT